MSDPVSDISVSGGSASAAPGFDPFESGLPLDTAVSRPQAGTVLLEVDGEIDTLTAPRLQAALDAAQDAAHSGVPDGDGGGRATVVVDLSGVTFLASSGLAALITGARRAAGTGARLHLVTATRAVTRPLQVTGADALFETHPDLASALAATAPGTIAPPPGE